MGEREGTCEGGQSVFIDESVLSLSAGRSRVAPLHMLTHIEDDDQMTRVIN